MLREADTVLAAYERLLFQEIKQSKVSVSLVDV